MTEPSRPACPIVAWCALDAGHDGACSLIRPIAVPRFDTASIERFVAGVAASLKKARTRTDYVLVPNPAVGGTMQDTDRVDVDRFIDAQRKARDNSDGYEAIAHELVDLITRYRGLMGRQVTSPVDGELEAPAPLRSSIVKLDMTDHLCRLERFQVAVMGYAGAWSLKADEWNATLHEDLAWEEKHGPAAEAVRTCRICQCTDAEACEGGCSWVEADLCSACLNQPGARSHLTVPADRVTDVLVDDPALKTPDEWCQITGTQIVDPDGWRGASGRPFTDPINEAEFQRRLSVSTTNSRVVPDDRG